ncbi:uncharacterized protein HMPREF1541_02468 [Cyphellophora europaea CBS 101466]|uniref:Carboxylesterase family protein n=1 Tax=Cyphellophora europaea (strain CBS 101466) TaxID=1220924 RepID=W2S5T7_CYPE1|nr:uncharacterized protein HMPREF1541_02468 [Cyphellophora europaea CBS 101466]ETN43309.1 hypothetical protein HMPREF1541_02468 [Cyphellophora europaea CBS 101466]
MRLTRAALRAQASHESLVIHEDAEANQELAVDQDDIPRPALKDITEENIVAPEQVTEETSTTMKKDRSRNKGKGKKDTADEPVFQEQTTSTTQSTVAPTSETVGETVTFPGEQDTAQAAESETTDPVVPSVSETGLDPVLEEMQTPEITEPLIQPSGQDSASTKPPKFVSEVYEPVPATMHAEHDSFVDSIKSRSPGKLSAASFDHEEDSFVEKIHSRSPRPASRIEDSVEAMDALEDAIEQFSGELPLLNNLRIESPMKEHISTPVKSLPPTTSKAAINPTSSKKAPSPLRKTPSKSPSRKTGPQKTALSKPKAAPVRAAQTGTTSRPATTIKAAVKAPVAKQPIVKPHHKLVSAAASSTSEMPKATMSFSNSPIKPQPNAPKQRVTSDSLSTSRPGFVPAKSTKPTTKSTFSLPGEVYAAKMKAQREEKLKQAEEEQAKKQFKARPAPSMTGRPSVVPRENKASQARLSRVISGGNKENIEPLSGGTTKRPSSMHLDIKKVRSEANSAIRRSASVTSKASSGGSREPKFAANVPRVASLTSKPAPPKEEPAVPTVVKKVNGKEVFSRAKLDLKKQEEDKREKEEAARKARAEAAERGRQASREWAEKQKARLTAQKAATAAV